MTSETTPPPPATVYFDGACPLCSVEIAHYRAEPGAERLCFIDVTQADAALGPGLDRSKALARFHVRTATGDLVSGAAAFVTLWESLPRLQWAARLARLPGVLSVMEVGYRLFLKVRPLIPRKSGAA